MFSRDDARMRKKKEKSTLSPDAAARAARFRQIRERSGLNQIEFARSLGLGDITWQNYERGISSPNSGVSNIVGAKLGINLNWLAHGDGEMCNPGVMEDGAPGFRPDKAIDEDKLFRLLLFGLRDAYSGLDPARLPYADYAEITAHRLARRIADMAESNAGAHKAALEFLDMEARHAEALKAK